MLVVDDNAAAREILQEPLERRGQPRGCRRVRQGGDRRDPAARRRPSRTTSCSWTGACPAWTACRPAATSRATRRLTHQPAIVLVTAFGREEVREEAERLQLDGFLVKPVTKSMIVDTLVNVFADAGEETRRRGGRRAGDAAARRADSSGRGQRDQPADRRRTARRRRRHGEGRQQRTRGGRDPVERPAAAAVRRGADGPADAGDGRLPGDREAPLRRALRHAADHRHDRARHDRGAPALSRRRHERPHLQADRSGQPVRDRGAVLQAGDRRPPRPVQATCHRAPHESATPTTCRRSPASTRRTACPASAATGSSI